MDTVKPDGGRGGRVSIAVEEVVAACGRRDQISAVTLLSYVSFLIRKSRFFCRGRKSTWCLLHQTLGDLHKQQKKNNR